MARPPDPVRRQELLDQVVRYLADHGMAGASLRPMAKALGVSLNGLVHHFGTKTDLLVAALARADELQRRESEGWLSCNPALSRPICCGSGGGGSTPRPSTSPSSASAWRPRRSTRPGWPPRPGPRRTGRAVAHRHRAAPGRRGPVPRHRPVEASLVKAMFTGLVVDLIATGNRRRLTRVPGGRRRRRATATPSRVFEMHPSVDDLSGHARRYRNAPALGSLQVLDQAQGVVDGGVDVAARHGVADAEQLERAVGVA